MRGAQRRGSAIRAHVYVDGRRFWRTFPATTPPEEIALWRAQTRKTAKWASRAGQPIAGTLAEDVAVYLETFVGRHPETEAQRTRHLQEWATAFPGRRRADLTAAQIERQLRLWQAQHHYAPATLNKRRQALYQLYAVLDRGTGLNPVSAVPTFDVPDPVPRGVSYARLRALFAAMPAGPSKWRLLLMAYAGLRPEEIRRIQAGDWDQATLLVRSAKGGPPARVPLLKPALAALEALRRAGALGPYTNAPIGRVLHQAGRRLRPPLVLRPYDLRHAYGTLVYQLTGDQRAAQAALRHRSITTTHRYTLAAVDPRLQTAVTAIEAALPALAIVPRDCARPARHAKQARKR